MLVESMEYRVNAPRRKLLREIASEEPASIGPSSLSPSKLKARPPRTKIARKMMSPESHHWMPVKPMNGQNTADISRANPTDNHRQSKKVSTLPF
jgi:hypothetical protein